MSTQAPAKQKSLLKRWRKGWITGLVLLLVLGIVLAGTPLLISQQFQKWVLANGGEKVSVEDVDFNPFTAELGLSNIVIERAGDQTLHLSEFLLKARWKDVFQRRFVIEGVKLNGLQLTLEQLHPEQGHVGGILLKNLAADDTAEPEAEPWTFQLLDFQLQDFQLVYKHPALQSVVAVEALSLFNLDTDPLANPAEISLKGAIDDAPVALEGLLALFSSSPGFKGELQIQDLAVNPYLKLVAEELQQNGASVSIDSRLDVQQMPEGGLSIQQSGKLGLDKVRWQGSAMAVNAQQLNWTGELSAEVSAQNAVRVRMDGRLQGDVLGFDDSSSALSLQDQQLVWKGKVDIERSQAKALQLVLDGQLRNRQLAMEMPAQPMQLQNGELDWQGKLELELAEDGGMRVGAQGQLHNKGFALQRPAQQLDLANEQLSWQGELSVQTANEQLSLASMSDLELSGLKMQSLDTREQLLLADSLRAKSIEIRSLDSLSLEQLLVSGLSIGPEQQMAEFDQTLPGFANHKALLLERIDYSAGDGVHIEKIVMRGPRHALIRTEAGVWGFDSFLQSMNKLAAKADDNQTGGAEQTAGEEAPSEGKLPVRIDAAVIEQGGSLYIVDRGFAEPFAQKIDIEAFQLKNIDSSEPMAGSDLELAAKLADGSIDVTGQVALFASEPTFDLTGDVQALSLLPYGLFLKKYLGYEVESGSLNAQTNLSANEGSLDSTTELALNQLDIRALTEQELEALNATQNAGLETGLSMLKDKHNTIELSVPVKGTFDNLQVDPSDIINQALGAALKRGAKTYLAAALFPFGTLLVVADAVAGQAMQIKLDPVVFEPGSNYLTGDYPSYLEKVAGVLEEKPEINVKICAVATASDESHLIDQMRQAFLKQRQDAQAAAAGQQAQDNAKQNVVTEQPVFQPDTALVQKQLKALAVERSEAITRFLIDKLGVKPKRLINCQPKVDLTSPKAKPRADLLL